MDASRAEGCSSSSIPISPQWAYDVFVSFRGADTRKKFTSHLFVALEDNGFHIFRDDKELERGEFISDGLLKAIEGSRISLIVFSKDYVRSRWCLDELVKIMDCRETFKQIVVPIFYDVVPSDVRKQTGVLQDAFANHKKLLREEPDGKVEKWRAALTKAANLSGRHLLNDGDEAELIKMIIEDVRKGTEAVKGLILKATDVQVNAKAFEKMNNLWLLHLDYIHLTAGYEHISRRLLWLSWKGFPLDCIPWNFSMEKLVALDLSYSRLKKVWNGNMILGKLKFLYLNHCHYLTRTPDFSGLSSLEELLLNDCKSLVEVDESIRCLNKLLVLGMKNCTKLRKLPSSIWMLKSLERLDLSGCSNLENLAVFKGPLYTLWCLFFSSWTLPPKAVDSIGLSCTPIQASSWLKELNLDGCHLSYLPEEIGYLISLQTLDLAKNNLSTLPDGICNLTCLKRLRLEDNNVSRLPWGIGELTSLENLNLRRNSLCTLPDTIGKLSCLMYLLVENNKLTHLPSEIGDLDSLKALGLAHNNGFRALPESICKLVRLRTLNLVGCNLSHLPSEIDGLISLWGLYLGHNTSLTIPDNCRFGLSELEHTVRIIVPAGEEELRIWFPYRDGRGPNVSFVVPPSPSVNQKILGWIIRLVVGAPQETFGQYQWVRQSLVFEDVIYNKIRVWSGKFHFALSPTDVDHVWLIYIPQGFLGLQLEGGDEVEIPICTEGNVVVKKWAIDVIYEADEIHKGNDTWCQVVSI
ncbi:hypothetical protein RHMOL_Rhmol01G0092700 [Rhododendron molle]|uniref:Uncharacterized protein n=1 Tax=Rhododendron molle TaxID=49168 RepID=A0ACC0Q112_RHOML|nr:hypothetical protein RHMOL_Rhmol01G0092700 [Rhododendron molle]